MSDHDGAQGPAPRSTSGLSRRTFTVGVLMTAGGLAVGGCDFGGGGGGSSSSTPSGALDVGETSAPTSIDPTKGGGESKTFFEPAYDPLIYLAGDGSLKPRLATSWKYLDSTNRSFEMTLRKGVVFSDGAPLNAAAVKANIEYAKSAGTQVSPFMTTISTVSAVDDHTVQLHLSESHPLLPLLFSQQYFAGNMISPKAIATPDKLAKNTYGAGQYVLSSGQTTTGDHYTYVKNGKYWQPGQVQYEKVVVKVLPNENTALAALQTGQVDAVHGSYAIADAAKSASLTVAASPSIVMGIQLNDRGGTLSRPLADVRVRQALNYAVDRAKLAKALFGQYGIATEQPAAPGQDGYNDSTVYHYDPAQARHLLSAAGYAGGFTLPVVISSGNPYGTNLLQAMGEQFAKVGVKLSIQTKVQAQFFPSLDKYPASIMGWGVAPIYFMGRNLWLRDAVGMNPFHSTDPTVERLDRQATAAHGEAQASLDRQIVRRLVDLAWFVPVVLSPQFLFTRTSVHTGAEKGEPLPSVYAWQHAG